MEALLSREEGWSGGRAGLLCRGEGLRAGGSSLVPWLGKDGTWLAEAADPLANGQVEAVLGLCVNL